MAKIDLRKLALRLKVIEMLRIHAQQRHFQDAPRQWRQRICFN